jgi:hypothetical protein
LEIKPEPLWSENQIVTVQAYFAQKTGFSCPSIGIE